MKSQGWWSTGNAVYLLNYHFVWSTKYRRRVLIPPIDPRLSEMIGNLCENNHFKIIQQEVMSDHVHIFIFAKPTDSPSNIMKTIRGATAYCLFREFPSNKKKLWGGHLWNPSDYVGTTGEVSAETIKRSIENQKTK